jgi:hypothetical protein
LLTESLLLAAASAILGVVLAFGGLRVLLASAPAGIPRLQQITIDGGVLLFTAAVATASAILLGLAPALHLSRAESAGSLRDTDCHSSAGSSRARTRDLLVGCEFALSVVLLFATTLLVRSYLRVQTVDPGYRADHLLMTRITRAPAAGMTDEGFYRRLLERIEGLPGVIAAGSLDRFFIDWNPDQVITTEDQPAGETSSGSGEQLTGQSISAGYFQVMRTPLLKGRFLQEGDRYMAVISTEMARRYWPGVDWQALQARNADVAICLD